MTEIDGRELGRMQARIDAMERDLTQIKADLRDVRDAMVAAKGSWKMLVSIATLSATVGGLVTKFGGWLITLPK